MPEFSIYGDKGRDGYLSVHMKDGKRYFGYRMAMCYTFLIWWKCFRMDPKHRKQGVMTAIVA